MRKILVTGAKGQIGTELIPYLKARYGDNAIIASDIRSDENTIPLNVMDLNAFEKIMTDYQINTIIHLAATLSYKAEMDPLGSFNLNIQGLLNSLEMARQYHCLHFSASSIAAFGPSSQRLDTPELSIQRPTGMYGITKVTGELLSDYYFSKYGVDTRSLRFPGLISSQALPGGGTTDYAVSIYHEALAKGEADCYLKADTYLDMMYLPDALKAIVDLIESDASRLRYRNAYNISAMSVCPADFEKSIQKFMPSFKLNYHVDPVRQSIADSWPDRMRVQAATEDFAFSAVYDLDKMTKHMLEVLGNKFDQTADS